MITPFMRKALTVLGCATLAAFIGGLATSRCYWGYWTRPPDLPDPLDRLSSISAVQDIRIAGYPEDARAQLGASGVQAFKEASETFRRQGSDCQSDRIAYLVDRQQVPVTGGGQPIALSTYRRVVDALDVGRLLVQGEPGYPNAVVLQGWLVRGVDTNGRHLLAAGLAGMEASNDHYPYYEAVFEETQNGLVLLGVNRFFIDVAGIEGMTWLTFSLAYGTIAWITIGVTGMIILLMKDFQRWRRLTRCST